MSSTERSEKYLLRKYSLDGTFSEEIQGQVCFIDGKENELALDVKKQLTKDKSKLFFAESFTGGGLASLVTSVSGASEYFIESVVAYANEAKHDRLGVPNEILEKLGAVSFETCFYMTQPTKSVENGVWVSTTGIAGPKSDNTLKPVGLCYIGVRSKENVFVYEFHLGGDRKTITESAIIIAITLLLRQRHTD